MEKIRYAVIGTGWRAMFFVRAAKNLPELFELTAIMTRTQERAEEVTREYGVKAVTSLDALLETKPEFVVTCVTKAAIESYNVQLLSRGVNVLSETPLATDDAGLLRVYDAWKKSGAVLQLAEQYFLYPNHAARKAIIKKGLLGKVSSCMLSCVHDYHAISLMRFYMDADDSSVGIRAFADQRPIIATGNRGGILTEGKREVELRKFAHLFYRDGSLGIYDFAGSQYHSEIRTNHLRINGDRGEIFDNEVRWVDADNRPQKADMVYHHDRATGTLRAIDFDGERIYENPFRWDVAMSEDDIAVSCVLKRMGCAVRGGEAFYPTTICLRDGLLSWALQEAARTGKRVQTHAMPWDAQEDAQLEAMTRTLPTLHIEA